MRWLVGGGVMGGWWCGGVYVCDVCDGVCVVGMGAVDEGGRWRR